MSRSLPSNAAKIAVCKSVDGKPTEYRIEGSRGLTLLVQPSGVATYYLTYAAGSARRRLKLGRRDTMSLAQARIAAMETLTTVSKGSDPVADANASRQAMTVSQLIEAFLAAQDGPARSTREAYRVALARDIDPVLGAVPVVEVTADMVADALDVIEARGSLVQADRTKAAISSAITWGISIC